MRGGCTEGEKRAARDGPGARAMGHGCRLEDEDEGEGEGENENEDEGEGEGRGEMGKGRGREVEGAGIVFDGGKSDIWCWGDEERVERESGGEGGK